jgi:hypothetical protein
MSAFTLPCSHINALINGALQVGMIDGAPTDEELTKLGQSLLLENRLSCRYRYSHHHHSDLPRKTGADFQFSRLDFPLDMVGVLAAAESYQYQSCEHPEWATSAAASWANRLVAHLREDERVPAGTGDHSRMTGQIQDRYTEGWYVSDELHIAQTAGRR